MLFNSYVFLFGFLPLGFLLTYAAGRWSQLAAKITLLAASLIFYSWWSPKQLPLLLGSIVFNYIVGGLIQRAYEREQPRWVKTWLILGLIGDVSFLGWFKYANFIAHNLSVLTGADLDLAKIALPLAISFFTFQKIAYLIDSARGQTRKMGFLDFSLFAAFFPQLISGPIVHYKEIVPQLMNRRFGRLVVRNVMVGLTILAMGLFKKAVIADTLSGYSDELFKSANVHSFSMLTGWVAAITYTFQLYFDFSGYSDMAIGLGRMFGIKLPLNFHSPLRAPNIIEYWRRWHMTLQRFIVSYIFQPMSLPLNRMAANRRLKGWPLFLVGIGVPTFITFVIVGIWHGAGWTFVLFGVTHATYLCINEAWREFGKQRRKKLKKLGKVAWEPGVVGMVASHLITLTAVIFANVLFRAPSLKSAGHIWSGMTGLGNTAPAAVSNIDIGLLAALALSTAIVFLAPNTQQIMRRFDPAYNWKDWKDVAKPPLDWTWKPSTAGLIFVGLTLFLGVIFIQRGQAVFLYFNF
jgi:alginate O-acetyltransferase complex protein AlgI